MANSSAVFNPQAGRQTAPAFNPLWFIVIAGLLQIIYYSITAVNGVVTNGAPTSANYWTDISTGVCFFGSVLLYDVALVILSRRLRHRATLFFSLSLALAVLSASIIVAGIIIPRFFDVYVGLFGGLGQITKLLALTCFAIGVLRSRALPRYLGIVLLIMGTVTFPAIVAFSTPFGLPLYMTSELPFAVEGLMWWFVASRLPRALEPLG